MQDQQTTSKAEKPTYKSIKNKIKEQQKLTSIPAATADPMRELQQKYQLKLIQIGEAYFKVELTQKDIETFNAEIVEINKEIEILKQDLHAINTQAKELKEGKK